MEYKELLLMIMAKSAFHPNAFLSEVRNVRQGLDSRTKIIRGLEGKNANAKTLANELKLTYRVVLHHLRLLENEKIVLRGGNRRPFIWELTGIGQQRLKTA